MHFSSLILCALLWQGVVARQDYAVRALGKVETPSLSSGTQGEALLQELGVVPRVTVDAPPFSLSTGGVAVSIPGVSDDVVTKLWKGLDLVEKEHFQLDRAMVRLKGRARNNRTSSGADRPSIHILGPPDSGTNLITKMLSMNWPDQVPSGPLDKLVWKHSVSSATDLFERFKTKVGDGKLKQATVLVVTRSPISQLTSWHKAPYSLAPCLDRKYGEMDTPCFANTSPDCHDITPGVSLFKTYPETIMFQSTMDVYNRYVEQYRDLISHGGLRVVLVRYEDMVYTPEITLAKIGESIGLPQNGPIKVLAASSKGHGASHGREVALNILQSRSFLNELGASDLSKLCRGIRTNLVADLYEGTYTKSPRHYMRDCEAI